MSTRRPARQRPTTPGDGHVVTSALVPLRIFLGGTFLYAGIDKLVDPTFLLASGPGSIGEQLASFTRASPLAFLINATAVHVPVMVGLGMALLEIAIGLGTLSGLLFRLSAALGTAVSLLFWLTASWSTTPYFYGPDLPYAAGWLTLALAGTGGAWTLSRWLETQDAPRRRPGFDRRQAPTEPMSESRRHFLHLTGLAIGTLIVAGPSVALGRAMGAARAGTAVGTGTGSTGGTGTSAQASSAVSTPQSTQAAATSTPGTANGTLLASGSQLASSGAVSTTDPATGDPVWVIKLPSGSVVAYDAICTHAGCPVQYDPGSGILYCPCHGAEFDPAHHAAVLAGPTRTPLASIPIKVNPSNGNVTTTA